MTRLAPTAFPIVPGDVWRALGDVAGSDPHRIAQPLRDALQARLEVAAVYPVAAGRTALALLLRVLREAAASTPQPARREVVLPAYTCPSLVKVILDAQLTPRLVDVEPAQLSFAAGALDAALGAQTLAVIFVHPFGLAMEMQAVAQATSAAGAVLIEDAAQAMGAISRGRPVGSAGDYGIFSTGPGKPLALGGGGFLTANRRTGDANDTLAQIDARLDAAWRKLPQPGILHSAWSVAKLALVGLVFHPWGWQAAAAAGIARAGDSDTGQRYTMQQMSAPQMRAASHLLARWEDVNRRRRSMARSLIAALDSLPEPQFPEPVFAEFSRHPLESQSMFLRLPVLAPDESMRDAWVAALQRDGVGAGKMYGRTLAERFPELGESPQAYPGALALARRLLTLPTHHYVADSDPARIVAALQSVAAL